MRRSTIPVRSRIHSSFVSIFFARSLLVTRFSGKAEPVPVILEAKGVFRAPGFCMVLFLFHEAQCVFQFLDKTTLKRGLSSQESIFYRFWIAPSMANKS